MKAAELLNQIQHLSPSNPSDTYNMEIADIACDSREVKPGSLFVAIKGHTVDGHNYINMAMDRGASLIIGEQEVGDTSLPYVRVPDSRKALAQAAKAYYMTNKRSPVLIGITGTNGKTTTSYMLKNIFEQSGHTCSIFGTVSYIVNKQAHESFNSTPDPLTLYKFLAESNDDIAILEVSSHGIKQERVHALEFDHLIFTNLGHDHLDYHHSMEDYFETKASLFEQLKSNGKAVIYTGQDWGKTLASRLRKQGKRVYTADSDISDDIIIDADGQKIIIGSEEISLQLQLPGRHNFHNATFAAFTSYLAGVDWDSIRHTLEAKLHVPGRFEQYEHPSGATVIVDYAHTADALENILSTAHAGGAHRIFHVFGFRGGRDQSKRKAMIETTASYSSLYILTADDLNEVSSSTMEKELQYLQEKYGTESGQVIYDRTEAIKFAWDRAQQGDWIVITGKGHENYQQRYKFAVESDVACIKFFRHFSKHPNKKLIQS
ncbi:UDP-N-acetylmuramoyl-L-alanyl-D-glutamate--2,6-diaminopimelate ligase [Thalassobacillus pellis]|uniref:UDP-N-acetylmuramoyl-L-alanyl-D-glutamate--2, 6-diaminopimelate ligase n=1 Tax=Thalassobacillus pellis TaxID=748008 RepID=UPI001961A5F7|nr:UDP-N-acetylmuramoyl-L-alanyl-D-glutamate--2,6-diaminopimelate ligase [Thalassobacillus pellis]MBM7551287.1 UDP-N-acetylmuramoyl-L-alanyl-D-glutamate--2,6-diaminopimelate ligase [Thalassobacillus pellis]